MSWTQLVPAIQMSSARWPFLLTLFCTVLLLVTPACSLDQDFEVYRNRMKHSHYDYIIVGAGTSGSVLANRLSEKPCSQVLVLEAGGLPTSLSEVPLFSGQLIGSEIDWSYKTEPQENAFLESKEQRSSHPRGKVLGGSSTINGLQYVRGELRDFDEWAKGGASGWSWDEVLHYFKKAEDQRDPELAESGLHGVGGYQTVSYSNFETPLRKAYQDAMSHLGHKLVDVNSGSPLGFSNVQGTIRDGLRCSTEKAYLRPAASRENLDILINAHVVQVVFDEEKRARAVKFEHNNATHVVKARKEIILSAGVYGSPQILMLSGVGPKAHLEELQIPLVADLAVGENLHDHVTVGGMVYFLNSTVSLMPERVMNYQYISDLLQGKGPLTIPAAVEGLAAVNSKYQDSSENWPDLRFFFASSLMIHTADAKVKKTVSEAWKKDYMTVHPMVARPKSRGTVKLRSKNPHEHPAIDPRYFTHEYDLKILVEGMKFVEELVSTPPLQQYNPIRLHGIVPSCDNLELNADDYFKCIARRLTLSSLHPCCTCKMGDPDDPTTVVDSQLRVKGVSGLRVVDASVMPSVTSGNTVATCIMIGEKAADLIKGKH